MFKWMKTADFILRTISYWPPYFFSGVRVKSWNKEISEITVRLKTSWWNSNLFGTHFGGTLFSMGDPFYIFMLIHHLGKDYIVWDLASEIRYKKASRFPAEITFKLTPEKISEIKRLADSNYKVEPVFEDVITDSQGQIIAELKKTLYVRRKDRKKP